MVLQKIRQFTSALRVTNGERTFWKHREISYKYFL